MKAYFHNIYHASLFLTLLLATAVITASTASATPDYTDVGSLGRQTSGRAMNDIGSVVGSSYVDFTQYHAFLWQNGQIQDLGTLGGGNSAAYDINNHEQVVGVSYLNNGERRAFLWQDDHMQDLTPLLGEAIAYGINDNGKIVGSQFISGQNRPFILDTTINEVTTLGSSTGIAYSINNNDQVVGFQVINNTYQATLWNQDIATGIGPLKNFVSSLARDINDHGEVIGWSADEYGWEQRAFYWQNGQIQDIGPTYGNNDVFGINNFGQIIGTNEVGDHIPSAFLWDNSEIHDINMPDQYTYGVDVNNMGQLLVTTSDGKTYVSNTPEPSSGTIQQIISDIAQFLSDGKLRYVDAHILMALLEKAQEKIEKSPAACKILDITTNKVVHLEHTDKMEASIAGKLTSNLYKVKIAQSCIS